MLRAPDSRGLGAASIIVMAWMAGCSSDQADLGAQCNFDSQCAEGLRCHLQMCLAQCLEDVDCADGARCVEGACVGGDPADAGADGSGADGSVPVRDGAPGGPVPRRFDFGMGDVGPGYVGADELDIYTSTQGWGWDSPDRSVPVSSFNVPSSDPVDGDGVHGMAQVRFRVDLGQSLAPQSLTLLFRPNRTSWVQVADVETGNSISFGPIERYETERVNLVATTNADGSLLLDISSPEPTVGWALNGLEIAAR